MTELTRRRFGAFFVALGATTALAACSTTAAVTVLISKFSTYATEAQNFIDSVADAESLAGVLSEADAALITGYASTVDGVIQDITAAATSTLATVSLATAQGWVAAIESSVSSAVTLLDKYGVAIPAAVTTVITSVETVLPVLLAAVELASVAAARGSMTLVQAEANLKTKPKL